MRLWEEISPATTPADTRRIPICNWQMLPLKETSATILGRRGETAMFLPIGCAMRVWPLNGCTLQFYTPVFLVLCFEITHFKKSNSFGSISAFYSLHQKLPFIIRGQSLILRKWKLNGRRDLTAEGCLLIGVRVQSKTLYMATEKTWISGPSWRLPQHPCGETMIEELKKIFFTWKKVC